MDHSLCRVIENSSHPIRLGAGSQRHCHNSLPKRMNSTQNEATWGRNIQVVWGLAVTVQVRGEDAELLEAREELELRHHLAPLSINDRHDTDLGSISALSLWLSLLFPRAVKSLLYTCAALWPAHDTINTPSVPFLTLFLIAILLPPTHTHPVSHLGKHMSVQASLTTLQVGLVNIIQ